VAQTLPASLDLEATLRSTVDQLKMMLRTDVAAVLVWDASVRRWSTTADGVRQPASSTEAELPAAIRQITRSATLHPAAELVDLSAAGPGLAPTSRRAIYCALVARDLLVGVLAVESQMSDSFTYHDLALMTGLAEQAALAIDNARWFGRLRTLGAEEERSRIARDLHDRVAQSLAYLAFELDRISKMARTKPVTSELDALRHDVRHVVTEVRDTLYDLRTNVSETQDLVETLQGFLDRVAARSHLEVQFEHRVSSRLPLPLEREFWRIAQEAITNAEHHARAHHLTVLWEADEGFGELSVIDNGRGFPLDAGRRLDSYGLLGMRERADAIGAALYIDSAPGHGTTVRCRLETA
jgi:signal transduction histidine kinase